jgi:hypothetical protein
VLGQVGGAGEVLVGVVEAGHQERRALARPVVIFRGLIQV